MDLRYKHPNQAIEPLRVYVDDNDRLVFSGGRNGEHSIALLLSDDERVAAHAEGYAEDFFWVGHFAVDNFVVAAVHMAQAWRPLLEGFGR